MKNNVCLVTGANSGIGKATALGLAELDATVILLCRNKGKGQAALEEIKQKTGNKSIDLLIADLAVKKSILNVVDQIKSNYKYIDVLILNAGAYFTKRAVTPDGFERTLMVSYLSRFLLTHLLQDLLVKNTPSRIVSVVGSMIEPLDFKDFMYENNYSARKALARTVNANLLFMTEITKRMNDNKVSYNCFDPGVVRTNFVNNDNDIPWILKGMFNLFKPFFKSPQTVAKSIVYLASSPKVSDITGKLFEGEKMHELSERIDLSQAKKLWAVSEKLLKIKKEPEKKRK